MLYGVSAGPPGLGPGIPIALPPGLALPGLITCAPTGAENASAAITATPLKRRLVFICSLR